MTEQIDFSEVDIPELLRQLAAWLEDHPPDKPPAAACATLRRVA